jgi:hypothetical protein
MSLPPDIGAASVQKLLSGILVGVVEILSDGALVFVDGSAEANCVLAVWTGPWVFVATTVVTTVTTEMLVSTLVWIAEDTEGVSGIIVAGVVDGGSDAVVAWNMLASVESEVGNASPRAPRKSTFSKCERDISGSVVSLTVIPTCWAVDISAAAVTTKLATSTAACVTVFIGKAYNVSGARR